MFTVADFLVKVADVYYCVVLGTGKISPYEYHQTADYGFIRLSPKGATSYPDRGSYEYDQIRVSFCLFCFIV